MLVATNVTICRLSVENVHSIADCVTVSIIIGAYFEAIKRIQKAFASYLLSVIYRS